MFSEEIFLNRRQRCPTKVLSSVANKTLNKWISIINKIFLGFNVTVSQSERPWYEQAKEEKEKLREGKCEGERGETDREKERERERDRQRDRDRERESERESVHYSKEHCCFLNGGVINIAKIKRETFCGLNLR